MMKLAIIIPVYNALKYTEKCLNNMNNIVPDSLLYKDIQIVIADDGSTDGTSEFIRNHYPKVIILEGNGNLWWSGGVNLGIKHAIDKLDCEYILLWNNDIIPEDRYFIELTNILNSGNSYDIICSKVYLYGKENIVLSLGGMFNPKNGKHRLNGWGMTDNESLNNIMEVDWFPGMGTTINRIVFESIGFFDEKYFPQYHGDADFGLRATKAGFKITAHPRLKLWNDRSNTGFSNDKTFRIFIQSLVSLKSNFNIRRDILFYRRHAKSITAYRYLVKKYYYHIGGFIKWRILGLFGKKRNDE